MKQSEVRATASAQRRWRHIKDKMTTATITAGGIGVLLSILLIFFYLLYEILPLFTSADIELEEQFTLSVSEAPLYHAMEEQTEIGFRLGNQGDALFFNAHTGAEMLRGQLPLSSAISSFALESEDSRVFAVGQDDGRVLIVKHDYRVSYPGDKRLITPMLRYPYGETGVKLADGALDRLALRDTEDALLLVGVSNGHLVGRRWTREEDFLTEEVTLEEEVLELPTLDVSADYLLIGPRQHWLYVLSRQGDYRLIDMRSLNIADRGRLTEGGNLTDVRFLLGGISLLTATDKGEISQWFVVRDASREAGYRLQFVRRFEAESIPSELVSEHRRKGFLSVSRDGHLDIYHSTSQRKLLSQDLETQQVSGLAIAPRADALLVESGQGDILRYAVHNEHPEVSWSVLWSKIWYESYPEPDYVWQSSAADNDFEPKYSFAPLAFGTLKAAFYAMLIAAPLAICGAIYTAYFMAPALRRQSETNHRTDGGATDGHSRLSRGTLAGAVYRAQSPGGVLGIYCYALGDSGFCLVLVADSG